MTLVTSTTRLIEVATGDYPVYLSELGARQVGSFPAYIDSTCLSEFGYEVVIDTTPPASDVVKEGKPALVDGVWQRTWEVRDYSQEESTSILSAAKTTRLQEIEDFRIASFKQGFPHLFPDGEIYHVQVRDTDRVNILSYRTLAKEALAENNTDFFVEFRVYENVSVTLNAAEMVEMADASSVQVLAGYRTIWTLKGQTLAAQTVQEIPELPSTIFTS